ncbi:MAG: PqqD family protein [Lachnospiraceae bacterium]|nr:PqqD family protein [Lachnospiraceae bacterium]MEE3461227.1 PqqD family protein [Lachnospiraceae bacterium]
MKKKNKMSRDEALALYKTYVPVIAKKIYDWKVGDDGLVTLSIENRGAMNRIMQKLIKKPKISYIHLDQTGSFIWQQIDGENNVEAIAGKVHEKFGKKAEPLYDRLLKFFEIVESYDFIEWRKPGNNR